MWLLCGQQPQTKRTMTIEHKRKLENLEIATCAKSHGGIVIAQVKQVTTIWFFKPKAVVVPGVLGRHCNCRRPGG